MKNLLKDIDKNAMREIFTDLLTMDNIHIKRIVSPPGCKLDSNWYNQDQNEWVLLVDGEGDIEFKDGSISKMKKGDTLFIPANEKHKVIRTHPKKTTIWLGIFFS